MLTPDTILIYAAPLLRYQSPSYTHNCCIVYAYNQNNRKAAAATSADSATAATAALLQQQLLLLRISTAPAVRAVL
jgi:hypothetical protein